MLRIFIKIIAACVGVLAILLIALFIYVRTVGPTDPPLVSATAMNTEQVKEVDRRAITLGNNWFRKNSNGLFELYAEGTPYERGVAIGKLTKDLVQYQEKVFNEQIHRLVPSHFYLNILRYFVGWFNRNLDDHVIDEYKQEILGISESASHDYDDIAPAYQRILNYHGAHDLGHALQNMSLVGCTSFATWADASEDSTLIVARNFDFYVGDEFAKNKIVAFYNPDSGHKFMMVTFGGMTGVLSGMNTAGLTVTINAAKGSIPGSAAAPVSIVAREILQYASTIDEAFRIAQKRKMFVAESFLIGSASENCAAIIEKTPDNMALYTTDQHQLVCTNHFQSEALGNTELNNEHKRTSASVYRYERVQELLNADGKNSVTKSAAILRNQLGKGNADVGMGNEKSINQLVAHHSIIFQPAEQLVWVSTTPFQLGEYVCYDLKTVFDEKTDYTTELTVDELAIAPDAFAETKSFTDYLKFSRYRFPFNPKDGLQPDSLVAWNPHSYHAYMLAGDYLFDKEEYKKAADMFTAGLTKEIATLQEKEHMEEKLTECTERTK